MIPFFNISLYIILVLGQLSDSQLIARKVNLKILHKKI